jgi:retron-type reverse transcriptase
VEAVNMIADSQESVIAGCDGIKFFRIFCRPICKAQALFYFKEEINNIKRDLALKEGKTDQARNRKGISTNKREFRRRWLKSKEALPFIYKIKSRLKNILKDPLILAKDDYKNRLIHNDNLRFQLLSTLKIHKLLKYKSNYVKKVYILKRSGSFYSAWLSTLKDRTVQLLFKLVLEVYLEPLGDMHSFGFRPGRGCSHAIAEVANSLRINEKSRNIFCAKYLIIEGNFKEYFKNISHS